MDGPAWIQLLTYKKDVSKQVQREQDRLDKAIADAKYPEKIEYTFEGTWGVSLGHDPPDPCTEDGNWLQAGIVVGWSKTLDPTNNPNAQVQRYSSYNINAKIGKNLGVNCQRERNTGDGRNTKEKLKFTIYLSGHGFLPFGMGGRDVDTVGIAAGIAGATALQKLNTSQTDALYSAVSNWVGKSRTSNSLTLLFNILCYYMH